MNSAWQRVKERFDGRLNRGPFVLPLPHTLHQSMTAEQKQFYLYEQAGAAPMSILMSPVHLAEIFDRVIDRIIGEAGKFKNASGASTLYLTGGLAANEYYRTKMRAAFPDAIQLRDSPNLSVGM